MRPARIALACFLIGSAATLARAQGEAKSVSFAFATQAGSGIYSVEGRVVQIYRIPIGFDIVPLDDDRVWGVSFDIPITFGFYDYQATDVLEGDFPSSIGTASLLPGAEFQVRVKPNWILYPHVDIGGSNDFSGDSFVWVYDTGIRSVVSFPAYGWDGRAGQELLWAGAAQSGNALTDWYGEANAGFEFRHVLPWSSGRSQWDIGLFGVYSRFFKDRNSPAVTYSAVTPSSTTSSSGATTPREVDEQTELGFSFGQRPKLAWKKITMPKLGLSYRFGDGVQGVRFVIGEIF